MLSASVRIVKEISTGSNPPSARDAVVLIPRTVPLIFVPVVCSKSHFLIRAGPWLFIRE